jgi:hypothetical protein
VCAAMILPESIVCYDDKTIVIYKKRREWKRIQ